MEDISTGMSEARTTFGRYYCATGIQNNMIALLKTAFDTVTSGEGLARGKIDRGQAQMARCNPQRCQAHPGATVWWG